MTDREENPNVLLVCFLLDLDKNYGLHRYTGKEFVSFQLFYLDSPYVILEMVNDSFPG